MALLRICEVKALEGFKLKLTLTDGSIIERDVSRLLVGPIFEPVRKDSMVFAKIRVEGGTVVWPNGADLCPDVLIWGGAPPEEGRPWCRYLSPSVSSGEQQPHRQPRPPTRSRLGLQKYCAQIWAGDRDQRRSERPLCPFAARQRRHQRALP
jgi:hypothetical protein